MKLSEELVKLAKQRWFMEVIDFITYEDLMRLATKVIQLEAELAGMTLMEAEAEQFAEGMELVPEGKVAQLEAEAGRLRNERDVLLRSIGVDDPSKIAEVREVECKPSGGE